MGDTTAQRFGPYVILDRIGDGGMAEIFLAKVQGYSGFEKLIALKKILPRYSRSTTFAQMLIHEAKLAAQLQHHNVVQVMDLGEIEGQVYIAMEYVRGRDLAGVLSNTYRRKELLPVELALCIATEFLTGLDYAHRVQDTDGRALGLIHRDISPQNILISYEGEVKVTDFGIARALSEKEGFKLPGKLHGKFGYMSPEQVLGHEIDQRSDIFSAGVVLYEMLTGRRLFRGKDHKDTIRMIASHPLNPPSTINANVTPEIDRICVTALARDRGVRYQTMGALLGHLSRVADALPRRAATRDLSVYMRRQFGNAARRQNSRRGSRGATVGTSSATNNGPVVRKSQSLSLSGNHRVPLGTILLEQNAISPDDLEIALAEQRARGGRIGELLLASGTTTEEELIQALSTQTMLPIISEDDLLSSDVPPELLQRFPREAAESTLIVPVSMNDAQRSVDLVVNDPFDDVGILECRVLLGVNDVVPILAKRSSIRAAIDMFYGHSGTDKTLMGAVFDRTEPQPERIPTVLIADGEESAIRELVSRLEEENCNVLVAHDGRQARKFCQEHQPAVAILDASLPGIDGYNLLLEVRSKNEDMAVFISSNRGNEFRQSKALELGADDFFVKPFSLEITTSKVRRELQKRGGGSRLSPPSAQHPGVSGSLLEMTVLDIVQSMELGLKTAHVVIQYQDGRSGVLAIAQGRIVGSVCDDLSGEEALYAMMRPGDGLFRIEYRDSPIAPNITRPNTFLLMEAMRLYDEELIDNSPQRTPVVHTRHSFAHEPPTPPNTDNTDESKFDAVMSPASKPLTVIGDSVKVSNRHDEDES